MGDQQIRRNERTGAIGFTHFTSADLTQGKRRSINAHSNGLITDSRLKVMPMVVTIKSGAGKSCRVELRALVP